jgi:hypothetical protein
MQSVPQVQRPQIKMSPQSSLQLLLQKRHLTGSSLLSSTPLDSKMPLLRTFGSLQTKEGERAFKARSLSSSQISLWVRNDETACFALECMANAKLLEAAIAVRWKVRRAPGIWHTSKVLERPWQDGQPLSSLLTSKDPPAIVTRELRGQGGHCSLIRRKIAKLELCFDLRDDSGVVC